MAINFLGNIWLDQIDLSLDTPELLYLTLHEVAHTKQLNKSFFDRRRFTKKGRQLLELEATLNSIKDLAGLGYELKDFLRWELSRYLLLKYDVSLADFLLLSKKMIKLSEKEKARRLRG